MSKPPREPAYLLSQIFERTAGVSSIAIVRFGSLADMAMRPQDVRFTPNSGHRLDAKISRARPKETDELVWYDAGTTCAQTRLANQLET